MTPWQQEAAARADTVARRAATPIEVIIPGAGKKQVVDLLADQMLQQGYRLGQVDDYHARFDSPSGYWDPDWGYTAFRITFTLLDTPSGLRVRADMGTVHGRGGEAAEFIPARGGRNEAAVQRTLEDVKRAIAAAAAPQH